MNWGAKTIAFCPDALTAAERTGWPLWVLLDPNIPLPEVGLIPTGLLERRVQARLDAGGLVRR